MLDCSGKMSHRAIEVAMPCFWPLVVSRCFKASQLLASYLCLNTPPLKKLAFTWLSCSFSEKWSAEICGVMQSSFLNWCMPWFWALKPGRLGSDSTYPCPGNLVLLVLGCSWMFFEKFAPQMLGLLSCQSGCNPSILSVFIYQSVEKGLPADFLQFSSKVPTILDI